MGSSDIEISSGDAIPLVFIGDLVSGNQRFVRT